MSSPLLPEVATFAERTGGGRGRPQRSLRRDAPGPGLLPSMAMAVAMSAALAATGCRAPERVRSSAAIAEAEARPTSSREATSTDAARTASPHPTSVTTAAAREETPWERIRRLTDEAEPDRDPSSFLSGLVFVAFDHAADPGIVGAVLEAAEGRELPFFVAALETAAKETRDIGPVLAAAARSVAMRGADEDAARLIKEVWARECCQRRSFLVAALDGLEGGLREIGKSIQMDAELRRCLEVLSRHVDAELSAAARRLMATIEAGP